MIIPIQIPLPIIPFGFRSNRYRYRFSSLDSYQTDISVLLHIKSIAIYSKWYQTNKGTTPYQTNISVLLHIKPIRIISLNRLFTDIIFYLHYPHPIREVLQLLRKSITVVVRFLITLISTNFYFLAIALSISGTGSILNLSTVNINCNF